MINEASQFLTDLFEVIFGDKYNISMMVMFLITCYSIYLNHRDSQYSIAKSEIEIFEKLESKFDKQVQQKLILLKLLQSGSAKKEDLHDIQRQIKNSRYAYLDLLDTICFYVLNGKINKERFILNYKEKIEKLKNDNIVKQEKDKYVSLLKVIKVMGLNKCDRFYCFLNTIKNRYLKIINNIMIYIILVYILLKLYK